MTPSLCERCERLRVVISGKGSRFLFCKHSLEDDRYPKYPSQPVRACGAFREKLAESPDE